MTDKSAEEFNVDGYIEITFLDGEEKFYWFKDIRTWHINDGCLWIEESGYRKMYPLTFIKGFQVRKNTEKKKA